MDAEIMLGSLTANGFELTTEPETAQVVIINTCGFIEEAKQESINTIIECGELKKTGACKVLIAAGCLAQRYQGELLTELPELDGVVGTGEIGRIADICRALLMPGRRPKRLWMAPPPYLYDEMTPRRRLGKPHTAYVKIAEGCNRHCAFCAIPLMRGRQRSRTVESIVQEAERLASEGVKEINLISQDTINYGVDLGLRHGLTTLLRELVKVKDLRWIRPFYLYPQQIHDELIDLYAGEEKITKYIDMPLQHINDTMLKRMHRLGNKSYITRLVDRLRMRISGLTFRTAFIVGFPGETKAHFAELKQYLTEMEFDRLGVFLYSDEDGTAAAEFTGKRDRALMEERQAELLQIQEAISLKKSRRMIGHRMAVLVDGVSEETETLLAARHQGQAPEIDGVVYINDIETPDNLTSRSRTHRKGSLLQPHPVRSGNGHSVFPDPGQFVTVRITDAAAYDLVGHIVG
ncbi:MAG: 30S ribosomal protein S12 methylthiotransferase RimO [Nitrospiraceae bacterium]|nr:30S ribosomal protein S12 methylthiotransferase RimO [Nitrospiraceae bacterium]